MGNSVVFLFERIIDPVRLIKIARRLGRHFPAHILNLENLIQEEWVGILEVRPIPEESEEQFAARCYQAAWRQAVDAIRHFNATEKRGVRRLEALVENIDIFGDEKYRTEGNQNVFIDFMKFFRALPVRKQTILYGICREITLADIGKQLNLTEGRVCQLKTENFQSLKNHFNIS